MSAASGLYPSPVISEPGLAGFAIAGLKALKRWSFVVLVHIIESQWRWWCLGGIQLVGLELGGISRDETFPLKSGFPTFEAENWVLGFVQICNTIVRHNRKFAEWRCVFCLNVISGI
jgi:hypothetical protein